MIPLADCKFVLVTPPAAIVDNAAFTTTEIDTRGFRWLTVLGLLGATDVDMVAWKLTESDTSGSGHTDITGLIASGTTGDGRLPQDDDDNKIFAFQVDLKGRKQYIDVSATAGDGTNGTFLTILAILSRPEEAPDTTAERGLGGYLALPA